MPAKFGGLGGTHSGLDALEMKFVAHVSNTLCCLSNAYLLLNVQLTK